MPDSSRRDPPAESKSARPLADAVSTLQQATESLKARSAPRESTEAASLHDGGAADDEHEQYYRHLEERGALKDVDEGTDLSSLPPTVTHLRYPDGRVVRLGYN